MIKWEEITIRKPKGRYQPKVPKIRYKNATIFQEIVAFLYSTFSAFFQFFITLRFIRLHRDTSIIKWSISFFMKINGALISHSGRSPPYQFGYLKIKLRIRYRIPVKVPG